MTIDLEQLTQLSKAHSEFFLAGIDEVGRGPLAGPVVCATAALICTEFNLNEIEDLINSWLAIGITDSKKLSTKKRLIILKNLGIDPEKLKPKEVYSLKFGNNLRVDFSISEISHTLVDEMNILAASLYGMEESFFQINPAVPGKVLIDGNKVPDSLNKTNAEAVVKGDSKSSIIALASIIAKEYRDLLMKKMAVKYPGYGLESHAGYPTKAHKEALVNLGVTPIHRRTFKGVKELII